MINRKGHKEQTVLVEQGLGPRCMRAACACQHRSKQKQEHLFHSVHGCCCPRHSYSLDSPVDALRDPVAVLLVTSLLLVRRGWRHASTAAGLLLVKILMKTQVQMTRSLMPLSCCRLAPACWPAGKAILMTSTRSGESYCRVHAAGMLQST